MKNAASRACRLVRTHSAAAFVAALVLCIANKPATLQSQPAPVNRTPITSAPRTNVAPAPGEPFAAVIQPGALGAASLGAVLQSLGTTARVLMIAAHPDDEDTPLLAWLARGRHVETAYLSLTRGDGGQNLIGNQLGAQLGIIRTEELLAARRLDGARQFFTRAFDFGFSKNEQETFNAWPKDTVLGDVVRVVREFRPHVIVSVFSGTPRDGHGHHRVAGILAREAYDKAGDTIAFPVHTHGLPWMAPKFYRSSRFSPDELTSRMNVGEYSPLLGRSYAEIAAESRSQHKSQGFGAIERRGVQWSYVRREATRANAPANARNEVSVFDGLDTTWRATARQSDNPRVVALMDSADRSFAAARDAYRATAPDATIPMLATGLRQLRAARDAAGARPPLWYAAQPGFTGSLVNARGNAIEQGTLRDSHANPALWDAITLTEQRAALALTLAAGVAVEATAPRQLLPASEMAKPLAPDTLGVSVTVYNRGQQALLLSGVGLNAPDTSGAASVLLPDSAITTRRLARTPVITMPWWSAGGREAAYFRAAIDSRDDAQRQRQTELAAIARVLIADVPVHIRVPVVNRFADPVKGDQQIPVAVVPGITIGLDRSVEYARATERIERQLRVKVLSQYPSPQTVAIQLDLPPGLTADSAVRVRELQPGQQLAVTFTLRGVLPEGMHEIKAVAMHMDQPAQAGYSTISYDHITPQRSYGVSNMYLSAVPLQVPAGTRVGYIAGVSDDGVAALRALDITTDVLEPERLGSTDLSQYSAIVVGPRAYQVSDALREFNALLFEFAEVGGTVLVQYGQTEMQEPGIMPYPITLTRPAARVTNENAPVTVTNASAALLRTPNVITQADWSAWVQERALYMPSEFKGYQTFIAMNDPDEVPNNAGILATRYGDGVYVYTSLALFRQLPVGVPGAARLLVNLLSAKGSDLVSR